MQLSAPIYVLKRKARLLARQNGIALHEALDKIALDHGFQSWGHLASFSAADSPTTGILSRLVSGDLALIGARPGQGKTLLGLELAAKASQIGRKGYFFTLAYHRRDVEDRFSTLGIDRRSDADPVVIDTSDDVSADYIITRLSAEKRATFIVVDYLQLLDQRRTNPSLDAQMTSLQRYVEGAGAICSVISQIDRSFDLSGKSMPDLSDVRQPNPLDLSRFRKFFFLHNGTIRFDQAA